MKHYHALGGLHGYMPNFNEVCETREEAVDTVVQIQELGQKRAAQLKKDGYIELNLKRDGNEYAAVELCEDDCLDVEPFEGPKHTGDVIEL